MSSLRVNTIQNTSGVQQYLAQAWCNFNGTNGSIRASGNVSSVTRNATGTYTVNFTTAMTDANYCVQVSTGASNTNDMGAPRVGDTGLNTFTSSAVVIKATNTAEQLPIDLERCFVSIFR